MISTSPLNEKKLARSVGWIMIVTLVIGMAAAFTLMTGIDVNLTADLSATADNMLEAEIRLRAKAYLGLFLFVLDVFIGLGLYFILKKYGQMTAALSLVVSLAASILMLTGTVLAMNGALFAGSDEFSALRESGDIRLLTLFLTTSDYTSFHLALVLMSMAKAGFYVLFLQSRIIPVILSGWGLFASLFVAISIVLRDFIPVFGLDAVTLAFMVSNLIAIISTGLYLAVKGVRDPVIS